MIRDLPIITNKLPDLEGTSLNEVLGEARWPMADCSRCIGACCLKGMSLPLTKEEAENLSNAGASLEPTGDVANPLITKTGMFKKPVPHERKVYVLNSDCPNLKDGKCTVFDESSPKRPYVCSQTKLGGATCISAQFKAIDEGRAVYNP